MDVVHSGGSELLSSTNTTLIHPIMHALTSILVLGSVVLQSVLGRPDSTRRREAELLRRDVDSFVATEEPIALAQVICNIGSTGCHASGAGSGIVLASPSTDSPDCKSRQATSSLNSIFSDYIHRLLPLVQRCCSHIQIPS